MRVSWVMSEPVRALSFVCLGVLPWFFFEVNFAFDTRIFFSVRKAHPLQRLRFLPSRMGCNREERVVVGRRVQVSVTRAS